MRKVYEYQNGDYIFIYDDKFKSFEYDCKDLEHVREDLIAYMKNTPPKLKGDVIKKTGGAVKVRISKSSSTRGREDRLSYTLVLNKFFIFMRLYTKSKKKDLSRRELKKISELVSKYKNYFNSTVIEVASAGVAIGPKRPLMNYLSKNDLSSIWGAKFEDIFEFIDEVIVLE